MTGKMWNFFMGPVYDGIGHLVITPEDLIPALNW